LQGSEGKLEKGSSKKGTTLFLLDSKQKDMLNISITSLLTQADRPLSSRKPVCGKQGKKLSILN
jgi:hypothetical protein